jgi:adenine-specific DNA-methyltransferase
MQLNSEDNGKRRFIMVQLPEPCAEKTDPSLVEFKNIAEISKERIRRAGQSIITNRSEDLYVDRLDVGFRVLKVDTSNMADVFYSPDLLSQNTLFSAIENIRADRTPEDLLFQVMLDWGLDLTLPINMKTIMGKDIFFVDNNVLAACFDISGSVDEVFVKELAKCQPLRVVFRDSGYKGSDIKINVEQIFKLLSPGTEVKCI